MKTTAFYINNIRSKASAFAFLLLPFALLAQSPSGSENYIMSVELLQPLSSVDMNNLNAVPDASKKVSITYYDGLGREQESILHKATSDNKDIVTKYQYDGFGRQVKDYLPVPTTQATGVFIDPAQITGSHYQTNYGQSVWYSEKTLESSPLNRVMKQAAPGDDWAEGAGHEIQFAYYSNAVTEVDLYWMDASGNLKKGGYTGGIGNTYPAKSLSRVITTDENGNTTYEYKDKQGRVVLTRSYVEVDTQAGKTDPPSTATEKVDTYYVYDIYGNLVYVVPPKAAASATVGTVSTAIVTGLCYTYKYDIKNRMTERRLPGKGWEYMVYDKQNRLVATQDAEMRKPSFTFPSGIVGSAWAFTKYDKFGRVVYTGLFKSTESRQRLQENFLNTYGNNSEMIYGSFVQNGITIYHTRSGAFPKDHTASNSDILTVNYYDNYISAMMTADAVTIPTAVEGQTDIRSGISQHDKSLKGMPVASHVRVLPDEGWERTYTFYDSKARPLKTHKINHLGGYTTVDSKLKWRGMPEFTKTYHKRNPTDTQVLVEDKFTYDNQERMLRHTQKINGIGLTEQLISLNEYDLLGQLKNKKVGGNSPTGANRWQSIDYKYNIRGWLTDINDVGLSLLGQNTQPPAPGDGLFSFKILYNQLINGAAPYGEKLYNGNIAQTLWKTGSDNKLRGYIYNYDRLNRMTDAVFYKQDSNPFVGTYNEHLAYDVNGNITSLKRQGGYETQTLPDAMDLLAYTYNVNSNLLVKVVDDGQDNNGFVDSPTNTTDDYTYDLNGNMTTDKNKNITSIKYNYLNLPTEIIFGTGDYINYNYNAAGQKISKFVSAVNANNTVKNVEYLDGFQYTGGELNFFPHAEGYVNVTLGTTGNRIFNYVYNYTDHLGNIRLSYTKDMVNNQLKILDENHYYPFGLKHQKYTSAGSIGLQAIDETKARPANMTSTPYAYKYNGQEWQDELGLNMYDMDMRQYDPAIARWVVLDPVIHHSMSPYNAFDNNPVFWADPSGADSVFESLGTEVASVTNMSSGFSIGAGGKDNSKNTNSTAKNAARNSGVSNSNMSVSTDQNGNRTVTSFEHKYEGTNTGGNLGDDIITLMQSMYDKNGSMTQLTTSMVVVNKKGDISSKSTTATTKGEGGKWNSSSSDTYAYGLDAYAAAVSDFKSYDQTSPLQYQAKLNKEYNKGDGKTNQFLADGIKTILSAASSRIPHVGPAVSTAIRSYKVDVLRGEHAEDIGIRVAQEGQHKPTMQFTK